MVAPMSLAVSEPIFSLSQSFELMGLIQCALIMVYLGFCGGDWRKRANAALFYAVLAAYLLLPFMGEAFSLEARGAMALLGAALPAASLLLAAQVLGGAVPAKKYFLVLLVPVLGSAILLPAAMQGRGCALGELCALIDQLSLVYQVVSGGGILLGIMYIVEKRLTAALLLPNGKERWGVALALVLVNAAALFSVLNTLHNALTMDEMRFVESALGIAFIYLSTAMLFRIYPESAEAGLESWKRYRRPVGPGMRYHRVSPADAAGPLPVERGSAPASPNHPTPPSPHSVPKDIKGLPDGLSAEDQKLKERIAAFLEAERPYLQEDFGRKSLANLMKVPEHRISHVVNQGFGKNLSELLNEYRIAEAKRLLRETSLQVGRIAFESGFNSLASFNRAFRKIVGVSPSDYREKSILP
jgi:AraC-like DNA-binding protein